METQVELLWEKKIGGVKKVHIIDNNHVAVVSDKCFYMFEINGELKWKHKAEGVNKVVMCASFFGEYVALSLGWEICLFDIEGNLKWKHEIASEMLYISDKYVANGYTDEECSHISLFDIKGDLLWDQKIHNPIYSVYLYKESIIVCTGLVEENKNFYIFNKKGELIWSGLTSDKEETSHYTAFGRYIAASEADFYFFKMDEKGNSPELKWEYKDVSFVYSSCISNEYVVIGAKGPFRVPGVTEYDEVIVIDINTGNLKWKYKTKDEGLIFSVSIEEDYIVAGSLEGYLYLLDLNGNLEYKQNIFGRIDYMSTLDKYLITCSNMLDKHLPICSTNHINLFKIKNIKTKRLCSI